VLQCSVSGRSIRQREFTLSTSKLTVIRAAADVMNVGEALTNSHWLCRDAGWP